MPRYPRQAVGPGHGPPRPAPPLYGLTGIPDPRATSPERLHLSRPEAPSPQFVHAMRMAGNEAAEEKVAQGRWLESMTLTPIPVPKLKRLRGQFHWRFGVGMGLT